MPRLTVPVGLASSTPMGPSRRSAHSMPTCKELHLHRHKRMALSGLGICVMDWAREIAKFDGCEGGGFTGF